jgi:HlyD family secretion protein
LRLEHNAHPGQVSDQSLREARDKDSATEAKLEAADAAFSTATGRKIEALEKRVVTAPVNGVVWSYGVPGSWVEANRTFHGQSFSAVDLVQYDLLRLNVRVPEGALHFLHLRQVVAVRADPVRETFTGMVIGMGSHARQKGKNASAEIAVLNRNLTLTPGMYASAELPLEPTPEMLTIPVQAVRKYGGQQEVLVLDQDNRLQQRTVETGIRGKELVEITSGLRAGEQVAVFDASSHFWAGERVSSSVVRQ